MTWWFCTNRDDAEKYVWVEADRWFDAHKTAQQLLGCESVWATHPKTEAVEPPKQAYKDKAVYRAEWCGNACGVNNLRLEVRSLRLPKKASTQQVVNGSAAKNHARRGRHNGR